MTTPTTPAADAARLREIAGRIISGPTLGDQDTLRRIADKIEREPGWQPMETAPKTGPVRDVLLRVRKRNGNVGVLICHWAYGGGEDQPPFGPGWFFWTGFDYRELQGEALGWVPLPEYKETAQ